MRIVILALAGIVACASSHAAGSHSRKGYTKKDGTHVAPSRATNPNNSKRDNYSSKGNTNPHTGKKGTKEPDAPRKP